MKPGFLKLNLLAIFLIIVFRLLSCSSTHKAGSETPTLENMPVNAASKTPMPANKVMNIGEENFAKEWKSKFDATAAELERNRHLWQQSKIVNYNFVVAKYAGGVTNDWQASPVLIKVREGGNFSTEAASKDDAFRIDSYTDFDTFDKLFEYMRKELENGKILNVKFDRKFGYPKEAFIIFSWSSHGQRRLQISKFEAIK